MQDEDEAAGHSQRATRRHLVANIVLVLLALLFVGALIAYVVLARMFA